MDDIAKEDTDYATRLERLLPKVRFTHCEAHFSEPGCTHRFWLERRWRVTDEDRRDATLSFVMLNPSTADAMANDPTIERCFRRALLDGYSRLVIVNLFALCATNPKTLYGHSDPIGGSYNDNEILRAVYSSHMTICAWGVHGEFMQRGGIIRTSLQTVGKTLHYLRLTKSGHPEHPLYVPYSEKPKAWT